MKDNCHTCNEGESVKDTGLCQDCNDMKTLKSMLYVGSFCFSVFFIYALIFIMLLMQST